MVKSAGAESSPLAFGPSPFPVIPWQVTQFSKNRVSPTLSAPREEPKAINGALNNSCFTVDLLSKNEAQAEPEVNAD